MRCLLATQAGLQTPQEVPISERELKDDAGSDVPLRIRTTVFFISGLQVWWLEWNGWDWAAALPGTLMLDEAGVLVQASL